MAAHVMRLNNEQVPNTLPAPQPTRRDHGIISEYQSHIISQHKPVTPEIHGSLKFTEDPEDFLPKIKPQPSATEPMIDFTKLVDPSLCLTPEKKSPNKTRTARLNRGSDEGISLKPRNSQKVRFENVVKVKEMSPEAPSHSKIAPHPHAATTATSGISSAAKYRSDHLDFEELDSEDEQLDSYSEEVISIMASDLLKPVKQKVKHSSVIDDVVSSVSAMLKSSSEMAAPVDILESSDLENVLRRPELNSTLQVSREIRDIQESELDVAAAVKQKLQHSEKKKAEINEKASSKVNATHNQFLDLIGVDVQAEELFQAKSREKAAKVKMQSIPKGMKPEDSVPAPDILDYFRPEFVHESASFSVSGLPYLDSDPQVAPLNSAFEVYRHIRSWEGW